MLPITLSDQEIISRCEVHDKTYQLMPAVRSCIIFKSYVIKYGDHRSLRSQYETQKYLYSVAVNDPNAPRIPKVVDFFISKQHKAYLVMEFIGGATPANNAPEKVADALQWLRNVPAPPGVIIGAVGGGPARHTLFKEYKAPLLFSSKEALENYMNKVCVHGCFKNQSATANF